MVGHLTLPDNQPLWRDPNWKENRVLKRAQPLSKSLGKGHNLYYGKAGQAPLEEGSEELAASRNSPEIFQKHQLSSESKHTWYMKANETQKKQAKQESIREEGGAPVTSGE